ncbi:MAG: hypothetical protein IAG10_31130 [Planctomycetaceae bacterium]|nr:hypothetical protein [Planctomycetaceae bacterium]
MSKKLMRRVSFSSSLPLVWTIDSVFGSLFDLVPNRLDGLGRVSERFVIDQELIFTGFDFHVVLFFVGN